MDLEAVLFGCVVIGIAGVWVSICVSNILEHFGLEGDAPLALAVAWAGVAYSYGMTFDASSFEIFQVASVVSLFLVAGVAAWVPRSRRWLLRRAS